MHVQRQKCVILVQSKRRICQNNFTRNQTKSPKQTLKADFFNLKELLLINLNMVHTCGAPAARAMRHKHFETGLRFFCSHVNIISEAQYARENFTPQKVTKENTDVSVCVSELLNAFLA